MDNYLGFRPCAAPDLHEYSEVPAVGQSRLLNDSHHSYFGQPETSAGLPQSEPVFLPSYYHAKNVSKPSCSTIRSSPPSKNSFTALLPNYSRLSPKPSPSLPRFKARQPTFPLQLKSPKQRRPRKPVCGPCRKAHRRCDSNPGEACKACARRGIECWREDAPYDSAEATDPLIPAPNASNRRRARVIKEDKEALNGTRTSRHSGPSLKKRKCRAQFTPTGSATSIEMPGNDQEQDQVPESDENDDDDDDDPMLVTEWSNGLDEYPQGI